MNIFLLFLTLMMLRIELNANCSNFQLSSEVCELVCEHKWGL